MNYNSKTYYLHSGNIRGYSSYTLYDTEDKHSISILRNDTFIDCEVVTLGLADVLSILVSSEENNYPNQPNQLKIYPNPFNPSTTISFLYNPVYDDLLDLEIYNPKGQIIQHFSIFNDRSPIVWNGTNQYNQPIASGIYYSVLKHHGRILTAKKMVLMK